MWQLFIRSFPRISLPSAINTHFITYTCVLFPFDSRDRPPPRFATFRIVVPFTATSSTAKRHKRVEFRVQVTVVSADRGNGEAISKSKVQTNRTWRGCGIEAGARCSKTRCDTKRALFQTKYSGSQCNLPLLADSTEPFMGKLLQLLLLLFGREWQVRM